MPLPGHVEEPWQPLEEHSLHPARHLVGVRQPVVVVEDEDGGDAAGADHEHDAAEVHSCQPIRMSVLCKSCLITNKRSGVSDGKHVTND